MTDGRFLKKSALTEEKLVKIRELNGLAAGRGQTLAEMALSWILKDGIVTKRSCRRIKTGTGIG